MLAGERHVVVIVLLCTELVGVTAPCLGDEPCPYSFNLSALLELNTDTQYHYVTLRYMVSEDGDELSPPTRNKHGVADTGFRMATVAKRMEILCSGIRTDDKTATGTGGYVL